MIELRNDQLDFTFPDVHPDARLSVTFQRTLRIPDDDRIYGLPPGLDNFPLRHVDDFGRRVPAEWGRRGGVMLPMYQSEALWISFNSSQFFGYGTGYPFAIKIAAGKVNAVTGAPWQTPLNQEPQDYVVSPKQPWLDGFCVEKGVIRQFVAMPLGDGYSAEEQATGQAEHGGLQISVHPMRREAYDRRFSRQELKKIRLRQLMTSCESSFFAAPDMGLAPGGRMHQEISEDPYEFGDWDTGHSSRCFVHLCNSLTWQAITDSAPPTVPPTAEAYTRAGLPWFDYYADGPAVAGSETLEQMKSVIEMGHAKGTNPLPENAPVEGERVVVLREKLRADQVREGTF